jgi:hypothetical protein
MHIWTDIVIRELLMLVTLLSLGSGPASFLGQRFDPAARVAMAPVLGLCVGTSVFTTLLWFTPAGNTYWLLPILALISLSVAMHRSLAVATGQGQKTYRHRIATLFRSLGARNALALALVCIVVAAPLSYTLHERHSVGPTGFTVWDADNYTAQTDAMMSMTIREATRPQPPTANFTRMVFARMADSDQQFDATPLSANVNGLAGLYATDTQSLFLIAFLVAGALGAFAATRYIAPRPRWIAALAGVLFAGPFFLQLLADGSQAATCGLVLILPIVVIGLDALRQPRIANMILFGLLISGLMALYPLFVPGVALAAFGVLLFFGGAAWWRGSLSRTTLIRSGIGLGVVIATSILLNVVSFTRDVRYWHGVLKGTYYLSELPSYHLPYSVLPGWLLQTREFYSLTELGSTSASQVLIGVVLPILFITVIVAGLRRRRVGLILAPFVVIFLLMADYESARHGCSYCTDRTLLPIAPLSIGLLAVGIAALATAPNSWLRWIAIAVAIIAVVAVGERTRQERLRISAGAYFLDDGNRALLSHLPPHAGPVELEAYGQNPDGAAPGELALTYTLVSERNHEQVSVPSEYDDYRGLLYFFGVDPADSHFYPDYRYVLTRIAGVQTGRRVIARTGPLALQERTSPLDATAVSGLAVSPVRLDPQGLVWVEGPLHMLVVGKSSTPAWVSLRFQTLVPVTVPKQPGVTAHIVPGMITACVQATGIGPVRRATIQLNAPQLPGLIPTEPFALSEPPQGIQLTAMRAVEHCSLQRTS